LVGDENNNDYVPKVFGSGWKMNYHGVDSESKEVERECNTVVPQTSFSKSPRDTIIGWEIKDKVNVLTEKDLITIIFREREERGTGEPGD